MKPLHKELKDIRIEKGVTIEDISRETKIRASFLERMEDGDFNVVPEPFMRAFIREYAEAVGIDPARVIARHEGKSISVRDEDLGGDASQGPKAPSSSDVPKPAKSGKSRKASPRKKTGGETGKRETPKPLSSLEPPPAPSAETEIISETTIERVPDALIDAGSKPLYADEDEEKTRRNLFAAIFATLIIIAALAILYFNGRLPF